MVTAFFMTNDSPILNRSAPAFFARMTPPK